MIHLRSDEHGDRDVYSCPVPPGTACTHEGPLPESVLLGQIVQGRTMVGIRNGLGFEFTEWQWIPDHLDSDPGPVHHTYSRAFEDARRYAKTRVVQEDADGKPAADGAL